MPSDALIQVEQLSRWYGDIRAVDTVSFTLARGQVLGFLGPNGAGKSTTMRMLAGVLAPDAGSIVINGHDLLDQPLLAKEAIGYLPEQPPLYRELSVDEQLRYSAHLHGLSRSATEAAMTAVKARCGLNEVGKRLNSALSKGYQQRVGIAQAILHDPPVIILDEPTIGLDPIQLREVRNLIRELRHDHGVILSTHLLPEVQATCTHVQIMRGGRLVYASSLADLEAQQATSCLCIGLHTPPPRDQLLQLPGVHEVDDLGDGRFRLHHAPDVAPHQAIIEHALAQGWELWELKAEPVGLEPLFIDLLLGSGATE